MISIIIPTYNCARYIGEALDSVLAQTRDDYEIIVIDDGSTDGTGDLIKNKYPMVRYFFTEQTGVSSARNLGIKMSKGDLIAFLDADDMWSPDKLEKQVAILDARPDLSMVFTEHCTFNKDKSIINKSFDKRNKLMRGDIVKNIFLNTYLTTSTVMIKKKVFDKVGLFEEQLRAAEDDNMWMRISMEHQIDLIDEPLVHYRITEGSLSRTHRNCIDGVKTNIDLIKAKYPDLYRRLGPRSINNKYYVIYFSEGYYFFTNKEYDAAKVYFKKSIGFNPYKLKTYFYFLSCFLPQEVIDKIKQLKRSIDLKIT